MPDITIIGGGLTIPAYRTNEPIVPSDGYGGHQITDRPKKQGFTDWVGRPPFKLRVPLVLSRGGASVEPDRRAIDTLATGTDNKRPTAVEISGQALPIPPGAGREGWFIEEPDWSGPEKRRSSDKGLIRKEVTLILLEKISGDTVRPPALTTRVAGRTVVTHYRVKQADLKTGLPGIAARELGDHDRWVDIATLNGLRSSGQLKVGMMLKLP